MNLLYLCICCVLLLSEISSLSQSCDGNACYNIISSKANYSKASEECRKLNLTLAFIGDETAQLFLKNYINESVDDFYIGLKYIPQQRFIWDCNSNQVPHLNWPKNLMTSSKESCVYMQNGSMNMGPCDESRQFICSNNSHSDMSDAHIVGTCPEGFFRFLNKCYKMNYNCNDETKTWQEAQSTCKSQNSSLVIVDSMIEQEFLTALMTKSPQALWTGLIHSSLMNTFNIWVYENSTKMPRYQINFKMNEPNNVESEKCLMVYHRLSDIGRINDENCNKYLNYLCESPLITDKSGKNVKETKNVLFYQGKCKENYLEFNETCYKINVEPKSYKSANESCAGNLLFVHGYIDVSFIRSLMAFNNISDVWISVIDNIKGSNDHKLGALWLLNEVPKNSQIPINDKLFYFISSKVKGLHEGKSENKSSICYYFLPGHEKITDHLQCPLMWTKVGQKCFQVKSNFFTFDQSIDQCEKHNAKLATLTNMKEVLAINSSLKSDSWIGLNGESFLNDTWIDGTKLEYCLFRHTKNMKKIVKMDSKNICFIQKSQKAEWDVRTCSDVHSSYTCELPAKERPCPDNFKYIDGDCYGEFNINKTWDDAERFCQQIGGNKSHLASFHTWDQESLVFSQLKNSSSYWIGLRMYDNTKRWIDETSLNYQQVFYVPRFNGFQGMSCFSSKKFVDKDHIWWSIENCGLRKPFVCKISNNMTIITPRKKSNIGADYHCPKDFVKHGNGCFKLLENHSTWVDANTQCKQLFRKPNPIARLASFESISEFESVLSSLRNLDDIMVWIGLHRESLTKQLVWVDETPFNLMKSVSNYEDSMTYEENVAVEVSSNPFKNGRWWLQPNIKHLPYICRVDPHKIYNKSQDNEIVKPYILSNFNCPPSSVEYNGYCYYHNKQKLKFDDASAACKMQGASLLIINDTFEEHFIRSFLAKKNESTPFIWMGFEVKAPNLVMNWTATDNFPVYYTHWVKLVTYKNIFTYSDENPQHKTEGCYILQYNDSITIDNGMAQFSCLVNLPSICKSKARHKISPEPVKCAKANNKTSYFLDVQRSRSNAPCVRWDLVSQGDPYWYHLKFQLFSSFPFNKEGYLSYSLQRCSEFNNDTTFHPYSCYILKNNKYILEDCEMIPCESHDNVNKNVSNSYHSFVVTVSIFIPLFVLGFLFYVYRRNLLSNYRIRAFLANALGRHQPDWIRYPNSRPPVGTVSGTGFVNPVYTPLESRY